MVFLSGIYCKTTSAVIDMCASPGGKTGHLAALAGQKTAIYAVDKSRRKIDQIRNNLERLKIDGERVKLLAMDARKCEFDAGSFDRVLLDAPCSALGQRPRFKCGMKKKELDSFPKLQKQLFRKAHFLLKSGGVLVYSTCTINKDENEHMVQWAREQFSDLEVEFQLNYPLKEGDIEFTDSIGFFVAKFKKLK